MAKPKVFISSTCYDLGEIRESLSSFIKSYGFDPVLSEHGDVFYHPDLHTQESCINEVGNCQLFLLIIGGRFGGSYVYDTTKSITNAEYEAAIIKKIPVFTYIKRGVLDNHNLFQTNKDKSFSDQIDYPAIEKQVNARRIFEFINRVRRAPVNNGYEPFQISKEIENHLRKQLAGMFFEFLKNREIKEQLKHTNDTLSEIQLASNKLEDLVKQMYKVVDVKNADSSIDKIETISMARDFIQRNIREWQNGFIKTNLEDKERILNLDPQKYNWYEYIEAIGILKREYENDKVISFMTPKKYDEESPEGFVAYEIDKIDTHVYDIENKILYLNGIKKLSNETRSELLSEVIYAPE